MGEYDAWLNRLEATSMRLDPWPARALAATLGAAAGALEETGELPCLWNWLYFLDTTDREAIGPDGHAKRGGFLPPIAYPRRMFAGGRTTVRRPLRFGLDAEMTRTVTAIEQKRAGPDGLWRVTVAYDYGQNGVLCVHEERDFVYLNASASPLADADARPLPAAPFSETVTPDPVMLMRFSALTFNGHRIHYDKDYAVGEEGYGERVVHGPLTAVLLAEAARRRTGREIASFDFRARSPLLVNQAITLTGVTDKTGADLSAYDGLGRLAMSARVIFA